MQGLQVWDADGRTVLSTSDRVTIFLAQLTVAGTGSQSFTHPLISINTPFVVVTPFLVVGRSVRWTVSGSTLDINVSSRDANQQTQLLIGVY